MQSKKFATRLFLLCFLFIVPFAICMVYAMDGMSAQSASQPALQDGDKQAKGGALAKLEGVWRYNRAASIAANGFDDFLEKDDSEAREFIAVNSGKFIYIWPKWFFTLGFKVLSNTENKVKMVWRVEEDSSVRFYEFLDENTVVEYAADVQPPAHPIKRVYIRVEPQSARAARGSGLAKLDGAWHYDSSASIARDQDNKSAYLENNFSKMSIDVAGKKFALQQEDKNTPASGAFNLILDNGDIVVLNVGDNRSTYFEILDKETVVFGFSRDPHRYIFTRKEPHMAILKKLDGTWACDVKAIAERNPGRDANDFTDLWFSFDSKKRTITFPRGGKEGSYPLKISSSDEINIVLQEVNGAELKIRLLNNNTMLCDTGGPVLVLNRKK